MYDMETSKTNAMHSNRTFDNDLISTALTTMVCLDPRYRLHYGKPEVVVVLNRAKLDRETCLRVVDEYSSAFTFRVVDGDQFPPAGLLAVRRHAADENDWRDGKWVCLRDVARYGVSGEAKATLRRILVLALA